MDGSEHLYEATHQAALPPGRRRQAPPRTAVWFQSPSQKIQSEETPDSSFPRKREPSDFAFPKATSMGFRRRGNDEANEAPPIHDHPGMKLHLKPASEPDRAFCESLHRANMARYLAARRVAWDPGRYHASWSQFENFIIADDDLPVGLLRLLAVDGALEIRDLQVVQTRRGLGIGTWAVAQAGSEAVNRGFEALRLRVYTDNPARHLYARLGFKQDSIVDGVIHMSCRLSPDNSFKPKSLCDQA